MQGVCRNGDRQAKQLCIDFQESELRVKCMVIKTLRNSQSKKIFTSFNTKHKCWR